MKQTNGNGGGDSAEQQRLITDSCDIAPFEHELDVAGLHPLTATGIEVLQLNIGRQCNMRCRHCHVDAGPDRTEAMSRETFEQCLAVLVSSDIPTVDITGGAPEMNPHLTWFIKAVRDLGRTVMVRTNLTIFDEPDYADFPEYYRDHGVELISSLPSHHADQTDAQRGAGTFDTSIASLRRLNGLGYGIPGTGLVLNLVYNSAGAFLPPAQHAI